MGMSFQDELAAGIVLVRPALRSPNYVAGSSGWTVNQDGSAEFAGNVIIRGGITVGSTGLYYNGSPGAGNLVLSIAAAAGTDPYGNAYSDGLTVYGAGGEIQSSTVDTVTRWASSSGSEISIGVGGGSALMDLMPPTVTGVTWNSGGVAAGTGSRLGTSTPVLQLSSPGNAGALNTSSISLFGSPKTSNGDVTAECFISAPRVYMSSACQVAGVLTAGNRYVGSVTITPVANTPTSVNVTFPTALKGSTFYGIAGAYTSVPGTTVTGAGINNVTATGCTVWITRTNTTATRVDFVVEGV